MPGASDPVPWPDPDDHLVEPETRQEVVEGELIEVSPARPGHGDTHCRLDAAIGLYTAKGYIASSDLLTRRDRDNDFATDTSVRKAGVNPRTHVRYVEELAFEVFHTQSRGDATRRARILLRSGVRRLFGLFVDSPSEEEEARGRISITVEEWMPAMDQWVVRDADDHIADRCLRSPLPIAALLDLGRSDGLDNAAMRILMAKRHPEIAKLEQSSRSEGFRDGEKQGKKQGKKEGKKEGKKQGKKEGLLVGIFSALAHRGITLTARQQVHIESCNDLARLEAWLSRAFTVDNARELLD